MASPDSRPATAEDINVLMLHMTRLASWRLRTLGKALLWSLTVPAVLFALAFFLADATVLVFVPLLGPAVYAACLLVAEAPVMPD